MGKFIDLTGKQYGRLTVLSRHSEHGSDPIIWKCLCECGKEKNIRGQVLKNGSITSCGCEHDRTMVKSCKNCGNDFVIPICRDWREHCCSSACKKEISKKISEEKKMQRTRSCHVCGKEFVARNNQIQNGNAKYCSRQCTMKVMISAAHAPEANAKRTASFLKTMDGNFPKGENHHQWKGGRKAYIKRRTESGAYYRYTKQYRKDNPHKAREYSLTRSGRKIGRLPKGTVKNLYEIQKGKCAICNIKLNNKYHVDHIYPLKLGGTHTKDNIQILCPTCNVRKNAKDPIVFMQEMGFLL